MIEGLQACGADVIAYDRVATENMRERVPGIAYAESVAVALEGADGAVVVTDWDEFGASTNRSMRWRPRLLSTAAVSLSPWMTSSTKA